MMRLRASDLGSFWSDQPATPEPGIGGGFQDAAPEASSDPSSGIDLDFLAGVEGRKRQGYVPNAGQSGVTVGTGFDLGQHSLGEVQSLLSDTPDLVNRLAPYVGLKRDQAKRILSSLPLELSDEEVDKVDRRVVGKMAGDLKGQYEQAGGNWNALTPQQKTALYSVAHQYGVGGLQKNKSDVWRNAVTGDWSGVERSLRDPNQQYASRRAQEADLLAGRPTKYQNAMLQAEPTSNLQIGAPSPAFIEGGGAEAAGYVEPPLPSLSQPLPSDEPTEPRTPKPYELTDEQLQQDEDPGAWQHIFNWADYWGARANLKTGDIGWGSTPEGLDLTKIYPDDAAKYEAMQRDEPSRYAALQKHEWTHGIRNPWELHYTPIDAAIDLGATLFSLPGMSLFGKAAKLNKTRIAAEAAAKAAEPALHAFHAGVVGLEDLGAKGMEMAARGAPEAERLAHAAEWNAATARQVGLENTFVKKFKAFTSARDKLRLRAGGLGSITPGIVAREAAEQFGTSIASAAAYTAVDETTDSPGAAFLTTLGVAPISALLLRKGLHSSSMAKILGDERGAIGFDIEKLAKNVEQAKAQAEAVKGTETEGFWKAKVADAQKALTDAKSAGESFDLSEFSDPAAIKATAAEEAPKVQWVSAGGKNLKSKDNRFIVEYNKFTDEWRAFDNVANKNVGVAKTSEEARALAEGLVPKKGEGILKRLGTGVKEVASPGAAERAVQVEETGLPDESLTVEAAPGVPEAVKLRKPRGGFQAHDLPLDETTKIRELINQAEQDIQANPQLAKSTMQRLWETQFSQIGPRQMQIVTPDGDVVTPRIGKPIPPQRERMLDVARRFQQVAAKLGDAHPDMLGPTEHWQWEIEKGINLGPHSVDDSLSKDTFQKAQAVNVRQEIGKGKRLTTFRSEGHEVNVLDNTNGTWTVRTATPHAHVELTIPKIKFRALSDDMDTDPGLAAIAQQKDTLVGAERRKLLHKLPIVEGADGQVDWDQTAEVWGRHVDASNASRVGGNKLKRELLGRDRKYLEKTFEFGDEMMKRDPNYALAPNIPWSQTGVKVMKDLYDKEALRKFDDLMEADLHGAAKDAGLEKGSPRYQVLRSAPVSSVEGKGALLHPELQRQPMTEAEKAFYLKRKNYELELQRIWAGDPKARGRLNTWVKQQQEAGVVGRPASKALADDPIKEELMSAGHGVESVSPAEDPKAAFLKTQHDPKAKPVHKTYAEYRDAAQDGAKVTFKDADNYTHAVDGELVAKHDLHPDGIWHFTTAKPTPGKMKIRPLKREDGGGVPFSKMFENKKDALFAHDAASTGYKIATGKIDGVKSFREQVVSKDIQRGFYAHLPEDQQEALVAKWANRIDTALGKADEAPMAQREALLDEYKIYLSERADIAGTPTPRRMGLNGYVKDFLEYDPDAFRLVHVAHNGIPENTMFIRPADRGVSSELQAYGELTGKALTKREQESELARLVNDGVQPIKPEDKLPNPTALEERVPPAGGGGEIPPGEGRPPPAGEVPPEGASVGDGSGHGADGGGAAHGPGSPSGIPKYQPPTTWQETWDSAKDALKDYRESLIRKTAPHRYGAKYVIPGEGDIPTTGGEFATRLIRGAKGKARQYASGALKTGQNYKIRDLSASIQNSMKHFIATGKAAYTLRKAAHQLPWEERMEMVWRHEAGLEQVDGQFPAKAKQELIDGLDEIFLAPMRAWAEKLGIPKDGPVWMQNYWPRNWDIEASKRSLKKKLAVEGSLDPQTKAFIDNMDINDALSIIKGDSKGGAGTGFLKQRTAEWTGHGANEPLWAYEHEMMRMGFVPKVTNPVDQYMLKGIEMSRHLAQEQIIADIKKFPQFYKEIRSTPDLTQDQVLLKMNEQILSENPNAKPLKALWKQGQQYRESLYGFEPPRPPKEALAKGAEQPMIAVPEDMWEILNNEFNGPELVAETDKRGVFDVLRRASNHVTAMQLAASLFHGTTMAFEAAMSDGAIAAEIMATMMQKGGYAKLMAGCREQNTTPFRYLAEHLASFAVPGYALKRAGVFKRIGRSGWSAPTEAERLFHGFDPRVFKSDDPRLSATHAMVQLYADAGGSFRRPAEYEVLAHQKLYDLIDKYHHGVLTPGEAIQAIPQTIQGSTHWLFETVIPRAKFDSFQQQVRAFMIQNPGLGANSPEVLRESMRIMDTVDNRFGMINYDLLHYNSWAKNVLFLMQRAPGWNLGTVREVGGGIADIGRLATLKGVRGFQKVTGRALTEEIGGVSKFTRRSGYAAAMFMGVPLYGMYLQMGLTGELPPTPDFDAQGGEDWNERFGEWYRQMIAPRTGAKHPDGTDVRIKLPGIITDVYGYREHPLTTIQHKLTPGVGIATDLINNADYFGNEIVDPNAGLPTQAKQLGWYALKEVMPFSWTSAMESRRKGESLGVQAANFAGLVTHASNRFAHTRAERVLDDARTRNDPRGVVSQREQGRQDLIQEYQRSGMTEDVREGLKTKALSGEALKAARKKMILPSLVFKLKNGKYSPEDLIEATNAMTPAELRMSRSILLHQYYLSKKHVPTEARPALDAQFKEALAAVSSRAKQAAQPPPQQMAQQPMEVPPPGAMPPGPPPGPPGMNLKIPPGWGGMGAPGQ